MAESHGEEDNLQAVAEDSEINALFDSDKGQPSGSARCNSNSASYEINSGDLGISGVGPTEMHCGKPQAVMDREDQYLGLLQGAETFNIQDNRLRVLSSVGQVLVFGAR